MEEKLTHFDEKGNAIMVDVTEKKITSRTATASGKIHVNEAVMKAVLEGTVAKGDVLGVARVAGIMAVKQTAHLIPMCHTLLITKCSVDFEVDEKEAQNVIKALNRTNWNGRRVSVEVAGEEGGEGRKSSGRYKDNGRDAKSSASTKPRKDKPAKATSASTDSKKQKPSREERGYNNARGKKDDWQQFFKDEKSDFSEEGWARRKKKK